MPLAVEFQPVGDVPNRSHHEDVFSDLYPLVEHLQGALICEGKLSGLEVSVIPKRSSKVLNMLPETLAPLL